MDRRPITAQSELECILFDESVEPKALPLSLPEHITNCFKGIFSQLQMDRRPNTAQSELQYILFDESAEPKALPLSLLEHITNCFKGIFLQVEIDRQPITTQSELEYILFDESAEPKALQLSLLKHITNGFSHDREIGYGGFARVYKGMLDNGTMVAVKQLLNTVDDKKFIEEVRCLMKAKQKNIVRFLGYCADTQGEMLPCEGELVLAEVRQRLLCFEYLPNGSLDKQITDASRGLEWSKRYKIISGICDGLYYLHQNLILHLDLKPANILLDDNMMPKIADFGLSRCFDEGQSRAITLKLTGTLGYLAPEFYDGHITFKSDIYSLGIIIREMLTGVKGYSNIDNVLESWRSRLDKTEGGTQLLQVRVCTEIGIQCTDYDPVKRPDAKDIVDRLGATKSVDKSATETGASSSSLLAQAAVSLSGPTNRLENTMANEAKKSAEGLYNVTNQNQCFSSMPECSSNVQHVTDKRETSLDEEEALIIRRTTEKQKSVAILSDNITPDFTSLPIYGIGGIGKTTLAQLNFNDWQFAGPQPRESASPAATAPFLLSAATGGPGAGATAVASLQSTGSPGQRRLQMAATEASGGAGGKGIEEVVEAAEAHNGDSPAPEVPSGASTSSSADNGNLHRSSTMLGVIKDSEIITETTGPSTFERSKTEIPRQNYPANDPAKQLLDDKISIGKKAVVPLASPTNRHENTMANEVKKSAEGLYNFAGPPPRESASLADTADTPLSTAIEGPGAGATAVASPQSPGSPGQRRVQMAATEASGGAGGNGIEEVVGEVAEPHNGDSPAPEIPSGGSTSSSADNGNIHRSSTIPGVIKDSEIITETMGPSTFERFKTEIPRQNNPANDPAKQLLNDKISIRKKAVVPLASPTNRHENTMANEVKKSAEGLYNFAGPPPRESASLADTADTPLSTAIEGPGAGATAVASPQSPGSPGQRRVQMAATEASGGAGGNGIEEVVGEVAEPHNGDSPAPEIPSGGSTSSSADNGNIHRSSTIPGVIKDSEIITETMGPSTFERFKTEIPRQNNPANDPAKQLLDDKISIRKKAVVPLASPTNHHENTMANEVKKSAEGLYNFAGPPPRESASLADTADTPLSTATGGPGAGATAVASPQSPGSPGQRRVLMAATEASGGAGDNGIEEVVGEVAEAHNGDSHAPEIPSGGSTSSSADNGNLHRSSTMPGVIKDSEIITETTGPSNFERSKTEIPRQNNPAKQLLDDKISIRKKAVVPPASPRNRLENTMANEVKKSAEGLYNFAGSPSRESASPAATAPIPLSVAKGGPGAGVTAMASPQSPGSPGQRRVQMADAEASGGAGGKSIEEVVGEASEAHNGDSAAPEVPSGASTSSSADNGNLHRSSTMPAETPGPSNLERTKTERLRQNNPDNDPAKQLLDNKISIRKKLKMLNRIATVKDDGTVVFDVPSSLDLAPVDVYGDLTVKESLDGADIPYRPPMQIVLLIVGTRGDVQPFVAIGKRLQDYGHRVRLATHANYKEFVLTAGLEFFPLGGDPKLLAEYMVKNKGFLPSGPSEIPIQRKQMKEIIFSLLPACKDPDPDTGIPFKVDAIIANPPVYGHTHVAEALKVPIHIFFTMPWTPTSEFPHPLSRVKTSAGYRLSYQIVDSMIWLGIRDMVNEFRKKKLKLRPATYLSSETDIPHGYIWSPHLVPKPKDWGPKIDVVGFCFLDLASDYAPPKELVKWLEAGDKPIYVGFGSLPLQDPAKMTETIVQALKLTGQRGIINKGWGGLGTLAEPKDSIYVLDNCPHDWLFLQCKAVVHHGGAGTTGAGLKAACPTTIVSFFGDQPFWGDRVHVRGLGPPPIPVDQFNLQKLVDAIKFMLEPEVKVKTVEFAMAMESEDGATGAVRAFLKYLPSESDEKPSKSDENSPPPSTGFQNFLYPMSRAFGLK